MIINNGVGHDLVFDNGQKRFWFGIWNDDGINPAATLEKAKHSNFLATTAFTFACATKKLSSSSTSPDSL